MVAPEILDLFVKVRILARQLRLIINELRKLISGKSRESEQIHVCSLVCVCVGENSEIEICSDVLGDNVGEPVRTPRGFALHAIIERLKRH